MHFSIPCTFIRVHWYECTIKNQIQRESCRKDSCRTPGWCLKNIKIERIVEHLKKTTYFFFWKICQGLTDYKAHHPWANKLSFYVHEYIHFFFLLSEVKNFEVKAVSLLGEFELKETSSFAIKFEYWICFSEFMKIGVVWIKWLCLDSVRCTLSTPVLSIWHYLCQFRDWSSFYMNLLRYKKSIKLLHSIESITLFFNMYP